VAARATDTADDGIEADMIYLVVGLLLAAAAIKLVKKNRDR
jgi:hypothetical protein